MCASQELKVMEEPSISRFNSQSTNKTLIGSIDSPVSPLFGSYTGDTSSTANPIIHTPDNKQWIDLDVLSPKLVKELRRQYDPSIKNEPSGPLEKGAAKIKAFVRQTKQGIDIRLRRKINAEQEEITDIQLIPNSTVPAHDFHNEKAPLISELPTGLIEISELPDTSTALELDAAPAPSRTSTGDGITELLPKYEPRRSASDSLIAKAEDHELTRAPIRPQVTSHHQSASQSSIIATPRRGLSLIDHGYEDSESHSLSGNDRRAEIKSLELLDEDSTDKSNTEPEEMTNRKSAITESLQTILADLQERQSAPQDQVDDPAVKPFARQTLGSFQITKTTTYETETEVESSRSTTYQFGGRNTNINQPRKKKKRVITRSVSPGSVALASDSDEGSSPEGRGLLRMRTIPKRLTAKSGAEALWSSLIKAQANLLGAEHPLVYQAKSDLAHSRVNGHQRGSTDLASLEKSQMKAADMLGLSHPRVHAFTEELRILQALIGKTEPHAGDEDKIDESVTCAPHAAAEELTTLPQGENHAEAMFACQSKNFAEHLSEEDPVPQIPQDQQSGIDRSQSSQTSSKDARLELPTIVTTLPPSNHEPSPAESTAPKAVALDDFSNAWNSPHRPRNAYLALPTLAFESVAKALLNSLQSLLSTYGPEQALEPGKVRVRWTCSCGEQLHDDFVEQRPGAARRLEALLNRPRMHAPGNGTSPTSPSSSQPSNSFASSSFGFPPSSQTSWSSFGPQGQSPLRGNGDTKVSSAFTVPPQYWPPYGPSWLLTCANDDRYTTKLEHLDMAPSKITSDKDFAKSLRQHYYNVNRRWWRSLRIRGLTTIEFVQLEVHSNRFADIRKCPDMPEVPSVDYMFEPSDLLPPVGSAYLLHLFKHPEDYDSELITYLRVPKRHVQLKGGVGWGINLVEGFLADRVWVFLTIFFALGSLVFALVWILKDHDVQGASGIAAWILSFSVLAFGWLQSFLG